MNERDFFFSSVLPEEGLYCVLGLRGTQRKQALVGTLDEVNTKVQQLLDKEFDAYFGTAKFETIEGGRKADNAKWFKSYRVDLDCGIGKPYKTQAEALVALKAFSKELTLPKPMVVDSGRGLHVYWTLDSSVTYDAWGPIAGALANACKERGLLVDTACTEDAARVLRIPGTKNYKDAEPKDVRILQRSVDTTQEHIAELLSAYVTVEKVNGLGFAIPTYMALDATTKALLGNQVSRFGTIMKKSMVGKGCAQLVNVYKNQQSVDYNLWRGGLSIAVNCEDGPEAIHKISYQHQDYVSHETELKAADTVGKPYKCETFMGFYSEGCTGCPHKGKITSPIQLGIRIVEAAEADNKVVTPNAETGETVEVIIPKYPFPYFRGKNGGVYRKGVAAAGSEDVPEDELIYKTDFYVVNRLIDPDNGESVKFRLHTSKDGMVEFMCPLAHLVAKDKLGALLAHHGMVLMYKRLENMISYIARWVEELQHMDKAEIARSQFGWHDNDTKFIVGNREISDTGIIYSPSSKATAEVATYYGRKGSIHEWTAVANAYARPGNEARAFALFAGFGSPLFKFTHLDGAILHLTNNDSGVGKTTIQLMINSIWGHPTMTLLNEKDTQLSRVHRATIVNNIVLTMDELSNMRNEDVSDMAYVMSHGRSRNRMQSQSNAERSNFLRWSLIAVTSGNRSLHDQLFNLKDFPEGELMRIMELNITKNDTLSKEETDRMFAPIYENHGVAGDIYMRYVVSNLKEVIELERSIQKKLDKAAGLTQRERFWSALAASSLTGGTVAYRLGLHNIDPSIIYKWAVGTLSDMCTDVRPNKDGGTSKIGQFLNEHINNILIVNNQVDKRAGLFEAPIREPRGELSIRYEPDTKLMYLSVKQLREWCSKGQISFKAIKHDLMERGVLVGEIKKCMSKGSDINSPAVWALTLDCRKISEFDAEGLISSKVE